MGNNNHNASKKHLTGMIQGIHPDGSGLFFDKKRQIRVYHTLPGEEVQITMQKRQKGIERARLDDILTASKERIIPLCPYAGICGGCKWQHSHYSFQLKMKQELLVKTFQEEKILCSIPSIIPCPETSFYRNRMDYSFDFKGNLGLKQPGYWWSVLDLQTCFLLSEPSVEIMTRVREWTKKTGLPFWDAKFHRGFFRSLVIREGKNTGQRLVTLITTSPLEKNYTEHMETLPSILGNLADAIVWGQTNMQADVSHAEISIPLKNNPWIYEEVNGIRYRIYPDSFFQTNTLMAKELQNKVLAYCGDMKQKHILDLYCGAGFFSLALSKIAKKVTGIEQDSSSIESAKANAKENNLFANFYASKVEDYPWEKECPDLVILDPPRAGLHPSVLKTLMKTLPHEIIYISCNYRALVKELKIFLEHYTIENLEALDLFPHTPHVEVIIKLRKS